jgi:hypothetical protein
MKVENILYVQVMALKRGVHGRRASILCEKNHCLVELLDLLFYLSLLKDSTFSPHATGCADVFKLSLHPDVLLVLLAITCCVF